MMKILFLTFSLIVSTTWAKAPVYADSFVCPQKSKKSEPQKPVFLHEVNAAVILGVCGTKDAQNGNYLNFDVYQFPNSQKPLYSNHSKNRKVLVMEKKEGLLFIEKVKIGENFAEVFKNELTCTQEACKLEKEVCATFKKDKLDQIYKDLNDKKTKAKMKKLGCV